MNRQAAGVGGQQQPASFQPASYYHHHHHHHQQFHPGPHEHQFGVPHSQLQENLCRHHLQQALNVASSPSPICSSGASLSPMLHAEPAVVALPLGGGSLPPLKKSKPKKARTMFSNYQLTMLETTFQQSPYPDAHIRRSLASRLALDVARVQVWFQNRRAKWRKKAAALTQHKHAHQSPHSLPHQPHPHHQLQAAVAGHSGVDIMDIT